MPSHSSPLLCAFVELLVVSVVTCSPVFRFGAVLSTRGASRVMADAKKGYELFFDLANERSRTEDFNVLGRENTTRFRFEYEFIWREDNSSRKTHKKEVRKLNKIDKVHFYGGSHPAFANDQMKQTNSYGILDFYCCVGPDPFYEQDFDNVFGFPASNAEYTKMTIQRLSLEGVKKLWIIADADNPFTLSTCEAAREFASEFDESTEQQNMTTYKSFSASSIGPKWFTRFAKAARDAGAEAVVACVAEDEGKQLVDAFHDLKYPLKAFFLTLGPSSRTWVDSFEPSYRAENLLSAGQWHKEMRYNDQFFKNNANYVKLFQNKFNGTEPSYVSAFASGTGLTLHLALERAFEKCDLTQTNQDVDRLFYNASAIACNDGDLTKTGYERVLEALAETDTQIFFGNVRFNRYRRNVGLVPVTTQVLRRNSKSTGESKLEIKPVLPFSYATTLFRFPAENYYKEQCNPGFYIGPDPFDRCKECEQGSVSFSFNSTDCDLCALGEYMDKVGQSACYPCPPGTRTLQRGSKSVLNCSCNEHFYNPSGQSGVECFPCPEGAICEGDSKKPFPKEGYWMNATNRASAYSCDPVDQCVGGPDLECSEGNTGRLCQECDDGYFQFIDHCYRCPNGTLIVFIIIGLLVGWYVLNVIISRSVASLESFLGWAQLANIIGDVDLRWTEMLTRLFGVANVLDFDVDILEPSCLINNWGFKQNFTVQLCLPFVMSLMAGVGFLSSLLVYFLTERKIVTLQDRGKKILSWFIAVPESKAELERKWDSTIATFLASVDITYVTVAKYCFDVFSCETISGVSVLRSAPEIECNNRDHNVLMSLGSIGIVFYVLGYLACVSWIVFDLKKKKAFCLEKNIRRFGFIYQKFELEYYFTPIIIILRKLLFVLVLVYLRDPAFQIGALAVIINASLMIHVFTAPYVDTYIDVLFSVLLVALMFESFGGLMFYSDNLPQRNRTILEWIVMTTFFMLVCVFVVIFVMEMANKYYIYQIKKRHRFHVTRRQMSGRTWSGKISRAGELFKTAVTLASGVRKKEEVGVSFELVDTFKPSFVNQCMTKDESFIEEWDELTNMLAVYMSDQSPTSYLSVEQNAKFWRKMVDRFPEIVDYLAVVDEDTREQFKTFAQNLYKDFYLTKKVISLPLMKILNWRDRAPMAHWLTTASGADRDFLLKTVSRMYRVVGQETTANILDAKMEHGGRDPDLESRLIETRISGKQKETLSRISEGSSPLDHPALELAKTTTVALGVQRFKQGSLNGRHRKRADLLLPLDMQPSTSAPDPVNEVRSESRNLGSASLGGLSLATMVSHADRALPPNSPPPLNKCDSNSSDLKNNK